MTKMILWIIVATIVIIGNGGMLYAEEPRTINPFGAKPDERDDAVPGCIELSDGSLHLGLIFLTRDKRLKIADEQSQRQREIPLSAVKQIDCTVKKEWLEKEWKFKELTKDEKMYTGRSYPTREYTHAITLQDGRTISGGLSEIVYLRPYDESPNKNPNPGSETKPEQFILNKRNKGEIGRDLQSLVYVKSIKLGKEAYQEGKRKAIDKKLDAKRK